MLKIKEREPPFPPRGSGTRDPFQILNFMYVSYLYNRGNAGSSAAAVGKESAFDRIGREGLPSDIEEQMLPEGDAITAKLLGALRDGDHEAYNVVYRHYRDLIVNFLFKLLRSREDAEEIAQNVFMALWERRAELDPQKNIRTLLYTIARNAVMNQFKRQKVFEKYLKLSDADDTENLTAEDILIARERELLIEFTVGKMPSKRRKIYEMSRRENLSNEDIAQRLDTSRQNVANHLSQALRQIRHALGR